jgi:pantoate kinase
MERTVVGFCPGHISGYFLPFRTADPATSGSAGAGIVISEGVLAQVRAADQPSVFVNINGWDNRILDVHAGSPPIEYAMNRLGVSAAVTTSCRLPIGAGYGLSAAALLATVVALNELHNLGLTPEECAAAAHEAEIENRTGLGDVAACQGGGRDCRTGPGISAPIRRDFDLTEPLAAVTFGPLSSPGILGDPAAMEQVKAAYPGKCPKDARDLFRLSRMFAERSGLITPQVRIALGTCDRAGVPASMTMLGNGVFAYGNEAPAILSQFGRVYLLHVATSGVHLVEDTGSV